MAQEAIIGYLEVLQKDGHPIPPDVDLTEDPVKEKLTVALGSS